MFDSFAYTCSNISLFLSPDALICSLNDRSNENDDNNSHLILLQTSKNKSSFMQNYICDVISLLVKAIKSFFSFNSFAKYSRVQRLNESSFNLLDVALQCYLVFLVILVWEREREKKNVLDKGWQKSIINNKDEKLSARAKKTRKHKYKDKNALRKWRKEIADNKEDKNMLNNYE